MQIVQLLVKVVVMIVNQPRVYIVQMGIGVMMELVLNAMLLV